MATTIKIQPYEKIEYTVEKFFEKQDLKMETYVHHNQRKSTSLRIWSQELQKQIGTVYTRYREGLPYVTFTYKAFEDLPEATQRLLMDHFAPKMSEFIENVLKNNI